MQRRPGGLSGLAGVNHGQMLARLQLEYEMEQELKREKENRAQNDEDYPFGEDYNPAPETERDNTDDSGMGPEMDATTDDTSSVSEVKRKRRDVPTERERRNYGDDEAEQRLARMQRNHRADSYQRTNSTNSNNSNKNNNKFGTDSDTDTDTDDDDDEDDTTYETSSRRVSQTTYERQRRPSYTCFHGPPLPRGIPRIGRRAKPRPLRDLDVLQLAAGATIMLAPLTPEFLRKAINAEVEIQCSTGEKRVLRATCDWTETAVNGDHLWCQTSASGDFCYVGDDYCCKTGSRMKCSACKIICHMGCISALVEKVKFLCKPTFRDVGPRQYREHTETHHHWVHRRNQKGKCKTCGKGFQSKLLFGSKEIVAISCSWCKAAFHNKETCFDIAKIGETCNLGIHQSIIVPASWIVKLPRRGSFKSSLRKSPKKRSSTKRRNRDKTDKEQRPFAIKPIPSANVRPVIVFINPKSGGNQGAKLMQKFQWLLNPRQVFDLTQGGPKAGLEMFRKVSNLRVLACGGDGTVGWILSILDQINIIPAPSVGVLPLGTGNDLARALGWGGGYTDEPISKILCNIADGEIIHLDRWKCEVTKNPDYEPTEEGKDSLPLNVVNNYFSFGVDAQIALEFHEAREANPQKFNSRLKNKMFYGQAGGKDLLQRKWKDLCEFCTLECDGKDMTPVLKEKQVHAVVFLNIPSYCSGTHPWNRSTGIEQATDDGLIEVVGLTTYQMPLLQAGGHGTSIAQCQTARIVTKKTIPMQVDGEACRLNPSIIEISHLNKVAMVTKTKAKANVQPCLEQLRLEVSRITMYDYEQHHYNKEKLRAASTPLGIIMIDQDVDLDQVRKHINRMMEDTVNKSRSLRPLSENWCFLDSCTAERFFRIDHAQEHLHYVTDICTEALFVLDPEILDQCPGSAHPTPPVRTDVSYLLEKTSEQLIKSAKQGDLKLLKDLHTQGFSLLSIDAQGQTALHFSARLGHKDLVRYLIASAPPSILDMIDTEKGQTALHLAASNKRRTVCCMLVAAGASLTIKDSHGSSPRSLAKKAEDQELAAYLESQEQFESVMHEDLETTV